MKTQTKIKLLNDLYNTISGSSISIKERNKKKIEDKSFIYGEITFSVLEEIIRTHCPKKAKIFYDLGSGIGKAVLGAYLFHPFQEVYGIEYLKGLYDTSQTVKTSLLDHLKDHHLQSLNGRSIDFYNKDFTTLSITNADFVYINSTCFSDELMTNVKKLANSTQKGTIVTTLSKKLDSDQFEILESKLHKMSWGKATIIVHKKIA